MEGFAAVDAAAAWRWRCDSCVRLARAYRVPDLLNRATVSTRKARAAALDYRAELAYRH